MMTRWWDLHHHHHHQHRDEATTTINQSINRISAFDRPNWQKISVVYHKYGTKKRDNGKKTKRENHTAVKVTAATTTTTTTTITTTRICSAYFTKPELIFLQRIKWWVVKVRHRTSCLLFSKIYSPRFMFAWPPVMEFYCLLSHTRHDLITLTFDLLTTTVNSISK